MAIIFSKILTKTDIEKRLAVPTKHLNSLPRFRRSHAVEFRAMDQRSKVWSFRCSIRKKGPYKKPVLTKDWLAFVCSKNLKKGDKVTFHKETSSVHGVTYRVQAQKPVKIFRAIFGYAPII